MARILPKVPDVPDCFVITVMCAHAHACNAYKGEPGTSGTPGILSRLGGPADRSPWPHETRSRGHASFSGEAAR